MSETADTNNNDNEVVTNCDNRNNENVFVNTHSQQPIKSDPVEEINSVSNIQPTSSLLPSDAQPNPASVQLDKDIPHTGDVTAVTKEDSSTNVTSHDGGMSSDVPGTVLSAESDASPTENHVKTGESQPLVSDSKNTEDRATSADDTVDIRLDGATTKNDREEPNTTDDSAKLESKSNLLQQDIKTDSHNVSPGTQTEPPSQLSSQDSSTVEQAFYLQSSDKLITSQNESEVALKDGVLRYSREKLLRMREAMKLSLIPIALPKATSLAIDALELHHFPDRSPPADDNATDNDEDEENEENVSTSQQETAVATQCSQEPVPSSTATANTTPLLFGQPETGQPRRNNRPARSASLRLADYQMNASEDEDTDNTQGSTRTEHEFRFKNTGNNSNNDKSNRMQTRRSIKCSVSVSSNDSMDSNRAQQNSNKRHEHQQTQLNKGQEPQPTQFNKRQEQQETQFSGSRTNTQDKPVKLRHPKIFRNRGQAARPKSDYLSDALNYDQLDFGKTTDRTSTAKPPVAPSHRQRSPVKYQRTTSQNSAASQDNFKSVSFAPIDIIASADTEPPSRSAQPSGIAPGFTPSSPSGMTVRLSGESGRRQVVDSFHTAVLNFSPAPDATEEELPQYVVIDTSVPSVAPPDAMPNRQRVDSVGRKKQNTTRKPQANNSYSEFRGQGHAFGYDQEVDLDTGYNKRNRSSSRNKKQREQYDDHDYHQQDALNRRSQSMGRISQDYYDDYEESQTRHCAHADSSNEYPSHNNRPNRSRSFNNKQQRPEDNFDSSRQRAEINAGGNVKKSKSFNTGQNRGSENTVPRYAEKREKNYEVAYDYDQDRYFGQVLAAEHGYSNDRRKRGTRTAPQESNAHVSWTTHNEQGARGYENKPPSGQRNKPTCMTRNNPEYNSYEETNGYLNTHSMHEMNQFFQELPQKQRSAKPANARKTKAESRPLYEVPANRNTQTSSPEKPMRYQVIADASAAENRTIVRLAPENKPTELTKQPQGMTNDQWANFKNIDPTFLAKIAQTKPHASAEPPRTSQNTHTFNFGSKQRSDNDYSQRDFRFSGEQDGEEEAAGAKSSRALRNAQRRRKQREKKRNMQAGHEQ